MFAIKSWYSKVVVVGFNEGHKILWLNIANNSCLGIENNLSENYKLSCLKLVNQDNWSVHWFLSEALPYFKHLIAFDTYSTTLSKIRKEESPVDKALS